MILNIKGPKDTFSTTIQVNEIVRLETCVLQYFGNKLFNLYIIVKADISDIDENFHLLPYTQLKDLKAAHSSIANILKKERQGDDIIKIVPS